MKIETKGLAFRYKSDCVLSEIELRLYPGITAVIGPNGAGKSTLLRCLAGIIRCEGSVLVDGESIHQMSSASRSQTVRYLPQSFESRAALTVYEAVLLGRLSMLGLSVGQDDRNAVESLLKNFDLGPLRERNLNELSGGQAQRVAIAQAFAADAQSYLFDEPTSNLDLRFALDVLNRLHSLSRQAELTTVIAIHDLNLAAMFADRICVLDSGRLYADGSPSEVLTSDMIRQVYGVNAEVKIDSNDVPNVRVLNSAI